MIGESQMGTKQVVSFNEVRAEKEGDSTLWTPREAVEKLLRDIVEGRRNPNVLYVCLAQSTGRGTEQIYHYCAGGSNMEYAGLLSYHLSDLTRDTGE
jgi:hypothetical protein